jgi:polysaccharide biosynthesis transport protein
MPNSSLKHYLNVLRRQAWLVIIVPAVLIATAALLTVRQETIYRSSMKIVTVQAGGEVQPEFGSQALMQTMSSLLESEIVARRAIERLGLRTSPKKLLKRLHSTYEPNSSVLDVTFDWPNRPEGVTVLANIATVFENLVDEKLGVRTGGSILGRRARPTVVASVFDPAHSLPDPVAPKPVRTLGFAAVLGLVLGVILAIARENLDSRIRGRAEAEASFRAPVGGSLPKGVRGKSPPGVAAGKNASDVKPDVLQWLRANLELAKAGPNAPTILVTSASAGDGKSTVAAHLAASLALARKRVICVDADLRRPALHRYFGLEEGSTGLTDVLRGDTDLEDALHHVRLLAPSFHGNSDRRPDRRPILESTANQPRTAANDGSLHVLTAGGITPSPDTLLTPDAVAELVTQLRAKAEFVIFDTAPLLRSADTFPLVLRSDNVLAVARLGRTTREEAEAVRSTLDALGAQNVLIVLTDASERDGYGYGYG